MFLSNLKTSNIVKCVPGYKFRMNTTNIVIFLFYHVPMELSLGWVDPMRESWLYRESGMEDTRERAIRKEEDPRRENI